MLLTCFLLILVMKTIDSRLPVFYDCIGEAEDASASSQQVLYFEDEPTKNKVRMRYQGILVDDPVAEENGEAK